LSSDNQKKMSNAQNIKISAQAWELLRKAKYNLKSEGVKSYSETIRLMDEKISSNRHNRLKASLKKFDESRHRVKAKEPDDDGSGKTLSTRPKTILLDLEAHSILERIKIESNESAYTFSDAIEFLVRENDLDKLH
jgi:hypothetical protein